MKLSKFLSVLTFCTCYCLLCIYLQTEIFRLAYLGQKKQAFLQDLLDKNSILRYNVSKNSSLINIENKISRNAGLEMPVSFRVVRLSPSQEGLTLVSQPNKRETFFARIFSIKRQAEAKTINP
jgi:hypothetical protein